MAKTIVGIILSRVFGFVFFLVLLAIANFLVPYVPSEVYAQAVKFFNLNIILLLIIMFIGIINDIFWNFSFPFNILAPISSAILGIYIVTFLYRIWIFLDFYFQTGFYFPIRTLYTIVFVFVLIFGYFAILARGGRPRDEWKQRCIERHEEKLERKKEKLEKKMEKIDRKISRKVEWDEVGEQFKLALYNLGKSISSLFEKKKKK